MAQARKAAQEFTQKYGTGLTAYIKQGWNELPELMATSALALVGIALGLTMLRKHYKEDGDNRPYKRHFTIMRPDDPRADRVRALLAREAAAKKS